MQMTAACFNKDILQQTKMKSCGAAEMVAQQMWGKYDFWLKSESQ